MHQFTSEGLFSPRSSVDYFYEIIYSVNFILLKNYVTEYAILSLDNMQYQHP